METSIEELRTLGLLPSDETLIAARAAIHDKEVADAASKVEEARAALAQAEAVHAALVPAEEPVEEVQG